MNIRTDTHTGILKKERGFILQPPQRTIFALLLIGLILAFAYFLWNPGSRVLDGSHDLRSNSVWIQHGWLGDDAWFERNKKDKSLFRNEERIEALAESLASHGIRYVFPHLCPCKSSGSIAAVDRLQIERFLDRFSRFSVIPWIGGVYQEHCFPESPEWRDSFIRSALDLLNSHPRLAGIHINIEPMPSGNPDFISFLEKLHESLPEKKILSIAAYPPPTIFHPFREIHWDESYYRQIARLADQIVPMMYDTALPLSKFYQRLASEWTSEVLNWSEDSQVLLGLPAYEDAESGYHKPRVENLKNALAGVHAGLNRYPMLPQNYAGVCIYSEWEMDKEEWALFKTEFENSNLAKLLKPE